VTPALLEVIRDHVTAEAPRECCGLLVWDGKDTAVYRHCQNVAEGDDHFAIHPEDWVAAEDAGVILGVVHSHPGGTVAPSEADVEGCNRSGLPWWIFDHLGNWKRITPASWSPLGRPFAWGIQDCFSLLRDSYPGVPDFERGPGFWHMADLFRAHMDAAGFQLADGPEVDDVLLMSIRGQGVTNHCAVYIGSGRIVHHLPGRLSREEDLGPLNRAVTGVVRRVRC